MTNGKQCRHSIQRLKIKRACFSQLTRLLWIYTLFSGVILLPLIMKALNELKLLIPKNKNEQQKIASCLSYLDELIMAETDKIEQLRQHIKGLMQGLFPKDVKFCVSKKE